MEDNNTLLAAGILIFAMLIIIVFASFGKKRIQTPSIGPD